MYVYTYHYYHTKSNITIRRYGLLHKVRSCESFFDVLYFYFDLVSIRPVNFTSRVMTTCSYGSYTHTHTHIHSLTKQMSYTLVFVAPGVSITTTLMIDSRAYNLYLTVFSCVDVKLENTLEFSRTYGRERKIAKHDGSEKIFVKQTWKTRISQKLDRNCSG